MGPESLKSRWHLSELFFLLAEERSSCTIAYNPKACPLAVVPVKLMTSSSRIHYRRSFSFRGNWHIERAVRATASEVERLIQKAHSESDNPTPAVYRELQILDEKLASWLSKLASKELKKNHAITETESQWIKRTSRFFHAYVPFLQSYFRLMKPPRKVKVFVSHSGEEKASYVIPLVNYLKRHDAEGIFVDKQDIPHGCYPDEAMLRAAVTCETFWCVLSESFVQRKWPIRELMIAHVRHLREQSRGFCLFMDCFEAKPNEEWIDRILKMESIHPYDENEYEREMPGRMEPMRRHESFDERIERLSGVVLVNGNPLVHPNLCSRESMDHGQVLLHRTFPTAHFKNLTKSASCIRFMNTWIPNLPALAHSLIEAIQKGATVEFLLLDPNSPYRDARSKALRTVGKPMLRDPVETGIGSNLEMIEQVICSSVPGNEVGSGTNQVQVRFFDSLPSISIFQADDKIFIGKFLHGKLSIECILFECNTEDALGQEAIDEFKILWECRRIVPNTVESERTIRCFPLLQWIPFVLSRIQRTVGDWYTEARKRQVDVVEKRQQSCQP